MTYAQRCIQTYQAPWGSFILDRIYFTHTSKYSYITIWVCTSHIYTPYVVVEVVRWRTCGGSKKKTSQDKNITKTANIKRHGFTVQKWLTHAHSLFSAQIGGFEFDIPHWLWDGWHDPRNYTRLHFQGLVCIDLTIPWHDPRNYTWLHFQGLVCIDLTIPQRECFVSEEGGWVKQNSPVLPVLP